MRRLALLALVAACDSPPLSLRFRLTDGDSQSCYGDSGNATTKCEDITLGCPAVLSVRIVPPNDQTIPYITACERMQGAQDTLCSIARVSLPEPTIPIPEQVLEVQMAVFPESAVPRDPVTNELICPPVEFTATGFPVTALPGCTDEEPGTCPKVPAVGGRAFYYPGDEMTVVTLGCSDLDQQLKGAACTNEIAIPVKATVKDFDSTLSVDQALANRLTVSIGEPVPLGPEYTLYPQDTRELTRTTAAFPPSWSGTLDFNVATTKCIVVLEDGAQTTSTLMCSDVEDTDKEHITTTGVRLSKDSLSKFLAAIGQMSFPDIGLTIGIVLDTSDFPVGGLKVTATPPPGTDTMPTIQYLSMDRKTADGTSTSTNGIFISQNAPYGTLFSVPDSKPILGGNVDGKVTIVVIHRGPPGSG